MSDQAPKANRRWIAVPWVLFIVAAVGWSAWWMIGARQVGTRMDAQAQVLRAAGYKVGWTKRSISGYPFRFFVRLDDAQIDGPGGWGVWTGKLEAETSALTPGVIVLVAPGVVEVSRPGRPVLSVRGDVLRVSIAGLDRSPPRVMLEGVKLHLAAPADERLAFSQIERLEVRLAPETGDAARFFLRIDKATPTADSALARIANGAPVTVGIEGVASQAAQFAGAGPVLDHWLAAGGELNIERGGLALGDAELISLEPSKLRADTAGFLNGALRLSTGQAGEAMVALGEVAVLPPDTAAVAAGVAPAATALSAGARITLHFHDGQTWLGPLPLGAAPRVLKSPGG